MQIWWGTLMLSFVPLFFCWIIFPQFRVAVMRTITFKGKDYCPVTAILEHGAPTHLYIECLQAKYSAHCPEEFQPMVSFYRHSEDIAVLRMSRTTVIAEWFYQVMRDNITPLCYVSDKAPKIRIDYKLYDISSFDLDEDYLVVYIKLENKDSK